MSQNGMVRDRLLETAFDSIRRDYERLSNGGTAIVWVNGRRVEVSSEAVSAEETLLQFLRNHLRLTSCKLGCNEGGCGACTGTTFSSVSLNITIVIKYHYCDLIIPFFFITLLQLCSLIMMTLKLRLFIRQLTLASLQYFHYMALQ